MLITSLIISTFIHLTFLHDNVVGKSIEKQIMDAAPKAEMFDAFHLMPHGEVMVMTELDLLLTLEQYKTLYRSTSNSRTKRKAVADPSVRWENCKVYYEITESLNTTAIRNVIKQAINAWERYSCLQFIESSFKTMRIQFKDGGGCYSQLGRQNQPQPLVLAPGCRTEGIIIHEIGHAIGWYHEHMRPDRDRFIQINYDVIPHLYKPNFEKYEGNVIDTHGIPYDYTSIMHYGNGALPGSITTLDPDYQEKIGQRLGMTFKDIKLANIMYDCANVMLCKPKPCPRGFILFNDHKGAGRCQCWCDSGKLEDPLILCSNIGADKPQPTINPVQASVNKSCYDVREDCLDLKLQDSNVCMKKMKIMMASCAKTCDFCGKGTELCMDHEKGCPILAATGACQDEGLKKIMLMLCPASCGHCEPSEPCEVQKEMMASGQNDVINGSDKNGGMRQASTWVLIVVFIGLCVNINS